MRLKSLVDFYYHLGNGPAGHDETMSIAPVAEAHVSADRPAPGHPLTGLFSKAYDESRTYT